MAAHIFSESGQMQEVEIPDIFDVLEGGEDENAVKYLLGFGGEEGGSGSGQGLISPDSSDDEPPGIGIVPPVKKAFDSAQSGPSPSAIALAARKRDTSGAKAIYNCHSCGKAFTTKFNLKRHINMHCHKSKAAGVPVQGPPSASAPAKKQFLQRPFRTSESDSSGFSTSAVITSPLGDSNQTQLYAPTQHPAVVVPPSLPSTLTYQVGTGAATATVRMDGRTTSELPSHHRTIVHPMEQSAPSPTPSLNLSPSSSTNLANLAESSLHTIQDLQPALTNQSLVQKPISVITTNVSQNTSTSTDSSGSIPLLQTVSSHLQQLGMSSASFSVTITPSSNSTDGVNPSSNNSMADVSVHLPSDLFENSQAYSPQGVEPETKTIILKTISTLPAGWLRKPVRCSKSGKVMIFYYNPSGKKFATQQEVDRHFIRLGFAVCQNVFDFTASDSDIKATSITVGGTNKKTPLMPRILFKKMPPKRRLSGVDDESKDGMDDRRSATPEPGRKKKKIDPQQQMQSLYDFLRKYKKEDGSELCEHFIRAPKRRTDPAYFEVVSDPIDMLRIQQKLKTEEYANLEELKQDFNKLIANALAYYKEGNDERKDAIELKELLAKAVEKIENGEDPAMALGSREDSEEGELNEMLEDLFSACVTAADPQEPNRVLNTVFRLLPSQKRYPEYYEVIKEPIDLKMIATKIQKNDYNSLDDIENDLNNLFKNAMTFNEPGSQIYKDAKLLMKIVKSKKYELDVNKVARENRGSRSRRLQGKKHYSSEYSTLQYEDSESEESEEENFDQDDPLWALYTHVRQYETPAGISLAGPFLTLPSKREFPDYFETVEDPISLNQIRKKLKNGEYGQLNDLAEDLNLMFENCKTYNRQDSRLYKDGVKLQKIFQAKLEELQMDDDEDEKPDGMKSPKSIKDPAKKRMRILYNTVLNHRNRDGVEIVGMFMEKPSRKDYPDYYEVISHPMDMDTINDRIKCGFYRTEEDMISDMKLMFSNCRQYNEEGSAIYEDANVLEKVLVGKAKDMGIIQPGRRGRKSMKSVKVTENLKTLFETLRDHKDAKGRQLSLIFLKLPNPKEFPDYFEVIKRPVDFETISTKLKTSRYSTLEECLNDFVLMFDNACRYNEPDSQIYKDALTLQNLAHRTCRNLQDDENSIPDVQAAVQELLSYIFISMYNHQDSEERCFSDSLAELPEHDEIDGKKVRAMSLDLIKQRLDKALYKRLDTFQKDVFLVLERARKLSRTDSQVFEDAVELQNYFIQVRDEACGNGDTLQSTALMYTIADLNKAVEELKSQKQKDEVPEEGATNQQSKMNDPSLGPSTNSATFNQQQYIVGEFVYVEPQEKEMAPSIYLIENIYTAKDGQQMMYANQFYRPVETFHVSSRKFLENEVFRTDIHESVPLSKIVGRCVVIPVRAYFRSRPEGFNDKDVYVCESRYASKARSFKKMKVFWQIPDHIKMVLRDEEIEPKRVMSIFKERIEKHKEELEEIEAMVNKVAEDLPPNVLWDNEDGQLGCVYYEQYTIPGPITLRRGDFVYVRSENGKNLIAQIDTMWTGADEMAYFHGPWYVTPQEMPPQPEVKFFKQEACLSTISDTNPLLSVVGKCSVLELREYQNQRATQYVEADVYVCENVYDESKRVVKGSLPNGLKQYEMSSAVQADEIYFFKSPITVQRESLSTVVVPKIVSMDVDNEDSLDAPPSVSSLDAMPTPSSSKKVNKPSQKKPVAPYILYSSEIRKVISETHKGCSFGEISRIVGDKRSKTRPRSGYQVFSSQVWVKVKSEMASSNFADISKEIGNQWRQLPDAEKQIYEERAKKLNEENALKYAQEQRSAEERRRSEALTVASVNQDPRQIQVPNGTIVAQYQQSQGRTIQVGGAQSPASPGQAILTRPPSHGPAGGKILEPIFHTVPPRPQRLLHSEAYIRYIEGLTADSQTMSNWERQLNATKESTKTDEAKLPAHWLSDNGEHGTSIDALWALRDFMMTDSLGLSKII